MLVSMLAHNSIRDDARILKEALSLKEAGFDVKIYGLTNNKTGEHFEVTDQKIPVQLTYRAPVGSRSDLLQSLPMTVAVDQSLNVKKYLRSNGTVRWNRILRSFKHQGLLVADAVLRSRQMPDIVHIHDHLCLTASHILKEYLGANIVWDAHEIYEDLAGAERKRRAANRYIISENLKNIDAFITVNQSIAEFYSKNYPDLPNPVILHNASNKLPSVKYDGRLHAEAALDPDQKILLFQGGLSPHRGISELLQAAQFLPSDWSVVFMGSGKMAEKINSVASSLPESRTGNARIVCLPPVAHKELLLWTAGATLGAIPYRNIGLNHLFCTPNKLWEFPAAGVPILATDLDEMGKIIRTYGTGIIIPREFTSSDIVSAVSSLSDFELEEMKTCCAAFVKNSNWETGIVNLLRLYAEL